MTKQQKTELILLASVDLEAYIQEYIKTLLWLTHGNHKNTPHPTVDEAKKRMKELKTKIISLLTKIETKRNSAYPKQSGSIIAEPVSKLN
jgi:hypothetical protein